MSKYGMPYKGSKNKIAKDIVDFLPAAPVLYDLFGGGGAITHCAAESGKWGKVVYNELDPVVAKGFDMAIHGKFKGENRWISREDFFRLKDSDPYVALCWSFGNDTQTYCYGSDVERLKKHLWSMCFAGTPKETRLSWKAFIREYNQINSEVIKINPDTLRLASLERLERLQALQSLEALERLQALQSLEALERLERLQMLQGSYADVAITQNSVIYCDIPYLKTAKYNHEFDYEAFYKWCERQTVPVFISEYQMPEDRFKCVWEKEKVCSFSQTNNTQTIEKIFTVKGRKMRTKAG